MMQEGPCPAGQDLRVERTHKDRMLKTGVRSEEDQRRPGQSPGHPPSEADIVNEAARRREDVRAPTTPDTSADEGAWPAGTGWRGIGEPITLPDRAGGQRPFWDGGGLCSPGKWPPGRRRLPGGLIRKIGRYLREQLEKCKVPEIYRKAIAQALKGTPFPAELVSETRDQIRRMLREGGFTAEAQDGDQPQEYECRRMGALLQAADDPDADVWVLLARGVPLGVGVRMPPHPCGIRPESQMECPGPE